MNHWLTATLGNISVNRKLGLGFGLVLLLTLLITITGWKGLTTWKGATKRLICGALLMYPS